MALSEFDMPAKEAAKHIHPDRRLTLPPEAGGFSERAAIVFTKARLNQAYVDLLNGNVEKVSKWLDAVAERSPAEAIRLLMELTEFVSPKLKAAEVKINADVGGQATKRLQDMSLDELTALNSGS